MWASARQSDGYAMAAIIQILGACVAGEAKSEASNLLKRGASLPEVRAEWFRKGTTCLKLEDTTID